MNIATSPVFPTEEKVRIALSILTVVHALQTDLEPSDWDFVYFPERLRAKPGAYRACRAMPFQQPEGSHQATVARRPRLTMTSPLVVSSAMALWAVPAATP